MFYYARAVTLLWRSTLLTLGTLNFCFVAGSTHKLKGFSCPPNKNVSVSKLYSTLHFYFYMFPLGSLRCLNPCTRLFRYEIPKYFLLRIIDGTISIRALLPPLSSHKKTIEISYLIMFFEGGGGLDIISGPVASFDLRISLIISLASTVLVLSPVWAK